MRVSDLTLAGPLPDAVPNGQREARFLQEREALDDFLAGVERRAFRIAQIAVRDRDDALDIVQDAMLNLVRRYGGAPPGEWPLLFFRILQNRIRDHHRRGAVRRRVLGFLRPAAGEEDGADPLAEIPGPAADGPEQCAVRTDAMGALERALGALPHRQQQAFLLRALEGLDVAATAAVMGCAEGSVKTHYSRAVHGLRAVLGEHWP